MKHSLKTLATLLLALFCTLALAEDTPVRGDPEMARAGWELIDEGALIIDVRSTEEFEEGHLEGAIHIPWDQTDDLMAAIGEDKQRSVVMYCGSGRRVGRAIEALEAEGYEGLHNASGLEALEATRP